MLQPRKKEISIEDSFENAIEDSKELISENVATEKPAKRTSTPKKKKEKTPQTQINKTLEKKAKQVKKVVAPRIIVRNFIQNTACVVDKDALSLNKEIVRLLKTVQESSQRLTVSFYGCSPISDDFLIVAFSRVLKYFDLTFALSHLRISGAGRGAAFFIRDYLVLHEEKAAVDRQFLKEVRERETQEEEARLARQKEREEQSNVN